MVMIAAMTAAEIAEAAAAAEAAATAAEVAAAAEAAQTAAAAASAAETANTANALATTAEAANTANTANTLATTGELANAGLSQIPQTAAAQAAPAVESATAVGGQGAGAAETQAAMQSATEKAALESGTQAPAGLEQIPQATPQPPAGEVSSMSPQQQAYLDNSTAYAPQSGVTSDAGTGMRSISQSPSTGPDMSGYQRVNDLADSARMEGITQAAPQSAPEMTNQQFYEKLATDSGSTVTNPYSEPSSLEKGWNSFSNFVDQNPKTSMALAYMGAQQAGMFDPKGAQMSNQSYNGPLAKYRLSDNFQAGENKPNTNQYRPTYPSYAGGGIMEAQNFPQSQMPQHGGYSTAWQSPMAREPFAGATDVGVDAQTGEMQQMASGGVTRYAKGNLTATLDSYRQMMESKPSGSVPSGKSDPGAAYAGDVYYDMDPDTRYQDALTAAQIRQAKLNKRANMQLPGMKRPTPMGSLNLRAPGAQAEQAQSSLDPENAAHGGIMQVGGRSSLGSYAAGGNPRLLKGPGDGMSDNIPATIAGKQPARLADGEFVVPADVVSHLGNGSTDAGAKKLHQMMTNVRKARTGNPKQGKQINPNKFTPK